MSDHLQIHGVRSHLSARGMAIRLDNGKYTVSHRDDRWTDTVTTTDLTAAFTSGLRMASIRESAQNNNPQRRAA